MKNVWNVDKEAIQRIDLLINLDPLGLLDPIFLLKDFKFLLKDPKLTLKTILVTKKVRRLKLKHYLQGPKILLVSGCENVTGK